MDVEDRAGLAPDELDEIAAIVRSQRTLEDVIRWGLVRTPRAIVADVVVQDEYTHDVVVPLASDRWLVYDTT